MAALKVSGLDRTTKQALVTVCCHADRRSAATFVSTSVLAAEMVVERHTVSRALGRLADGGYLSVERRLGKTSRLRIDLEHLEALPGTSDVPTPGTSDVPHKDLLKETIKERVRTREDGQVKVNSDPARADNPWVYDEETGFAVRADQIAGRPVRDLPLAPPPFQHLVNGRRPRE